MNRFSIAVIIPSADGQRTGRLDSLVRDVENQTLRPHELHVISDVSPSGRARNVGARCASSDILVFLDDDIRLGHERVLEAMVALLDNPRIGMVGAAQLLPPDSSRFQQAAGRQISRSCSPIVSVATDSDMVTTACCAIRRVPFCQIGGFNERIPRGVDPEMRYRVRNSGLRIVVAPDAWFYHPMPANLYSLWRTFFRNGQRSAEALWRMPSAALENPDGHAANFAPYRSQRYRVWRHARRVALGLVTLRWIGVAARLAYLAGYLWRWMDLRRGPERRPETSAIGRPSKS